MNNPLARAVRFALFNLAGLACFVIAFAQPLSPVSALPILSAAVMGVMGILFAALSLTEPAL